MKAKKIESPSLPASEINKEKWYADGVEKKLRYEYDLGKDAVVIDAGGYEGDFAAEIFSRYLCSIHVFEPVEKFTNILKSRFALNPSIKIIQAGIGAKNESIDIYVMDEGSSHNRSETTHKKGSAEKIKILDVAEYFEKNSLDKIGLMKINIEGAEYDLLDRMAERDLLKRCSNLQIQFHDFYPDFSSRYSKIKKELEKTHRLTYCYPYVWENWQLK